MTDLDYEIEQHRTAEILLGSSEHDDWRPTDERLRMLVEAALLSVEQKGYVDGRDVIEWLRELDPEHPWGAHLVYLLDRHDELVARAQAVVPFEMIIRAGEAFRAKLDAFDADVSQLIREADELDEMAASLERMRALIVQRDVKPEKSRAA